MRPDTMVRPRVSHHVLIPLLALAALGIGPGGGGGAQDDTAVRVRYPDPDPGVECCRRGKKAQVETAGRFRVFHQFKFTDGLKQSGITFVHKAVDDVDASTTGPSTTTTAPASPRPTWTATGFTDLYFVNQVGGNELWKNLGKRPVPERHRARRAWACAGRIGVAASFADVDNDGDQDLFVTTVRGGNALFENDGRGRFRDVSKQAGRRLSSLIPPGAVFFDYDKDGLLDLLVCNVGVYTSDEKGPDGEYIGLDGRLLRAPASRAAPSTPSSTGTWAAPASRT